jgi:hypothetical protein
LAASRDKPIGTPPEDSATGSDIRVSRPMSATEVRESETLEGVVGRVECAGPVEEFLPLLHIGQLTHAGKRAVFGLGRYRLRET